MRSVPLALAIFCFAFAAFGGEIREFDLKTIERLGNELTRVSQTSQRGATNTVRRRAVQTAKAALQGKLYNIHYDYVVLDDPDGSGFLVYAIGSTRNPDEIVLAGHFRVTVSPNGNAAERVDALSRSLLIHKNEKHLSPGWHHFGIVTGQVVSSKPLETLVYTSNLTKELISVQTSPNAQVWLIANGRITKDKSKK